MSVFIISISEMNVIASVWMMYILSLMISVSTYVYLVSAII